MTRETLNKLLGDISKDQSEWKSDPKGVMSRYDLSDEEQQALTAGDEATLRRLGVEERLIKNSHWN